MSDISHAGLLYSHPREDLRMLFDLSADIGNNLLSLVHGHPGNDLLCFLGCLNGSVHILENTVVAGHVGSNLHLRHHFLHNVLNHLFIYRHAITSLNTSLP